MNICLNSMLGETMKKIIILILITVCCSSCNMKEEANWEVATTEYEEYGDIHIELEKDTYDAGTTYVTGQWINETRAEINFGRYYRLEALIDNTWRIVSKGDDDGIAFKDIGLRLEPESSYEYEYELKYFSEGLSPGEYRISTDYSIETLNGAEWPKGTDTRYQVYGYFDVE